MKFSRGLAVVSLLSASFPLAVACGSADDSNLFTPSGGSTNQAHAGAGTSTAGKSAGGSAAKAGAGPSEAGGSETMGDAGESAGGASAGGAPAGGTNAGGMSAGGMSAGGSVAGGASAGASAGGMGGAAMGGGGSGGMGVSGGGSGGAPACPATAPTAKEFCTTPTPDSCFYAGVACSCLVASSVGPMPGGGAAIPVVRRWACYGTPDKCPTTKPTSESSCKENSGALCPYPNNDFCVCAGSGNEAHWSCQVQPVVCPAKPTPDVTACKTVRTCSYGDVACFCNANGSSSVSTWGCEGG